jgi:two-component system sensor histidine kinase UhpB
MVEERTVDESDKTRSQLLAEIQRLRQQAALLQESEQERRQAEEALRQARGHISGLTKLLDEVVNALGREHRRADVMDAPEVATLVDVRDSMTPHKWSEDQVQDTSDRYGDLPSILFRAMADASSNWEYWAQADGSLGYISPACEAITGYSPDEFRQDPGLTETVVHPEDRTVFDRHGHLPPTLADEAPVEFRIVTKSGDVRWVLHHCRSVFRDQEYLGQCVTNQDVTERKQLQIDLVEKEKLAWALLDASADEIGLFNLDGSIVCINGTWRRRLGKPLEALIGTSIWSLVPPEKTGHRHIILSKVVGTGLPVRFVDKQGDQWHEILFSPVYGREGEVEEIFTCTHNITQQIRTEERLKLMALQLLTIQEDERRRIAQDLHDDIGQNMTALILSLKAIDSGIAAGRKNVGEQVKETIQNVETMMKHIRQIFYQLRPPSLTTVPLSKVIESLCSSFALSTGLRVDFSSQEELPPIPDVQATALYRLVQEGLNNAVKHAKATSVWVNLDYADGEISLSMEDDGQGFDPSRDARQGMGLQGLRERFLMLNGCFDIESAPDKGTQLYGSLPLTNHGPEE